MKSDTVSSTQCHSPDIVQEELQELSDSLSLSWRDIAQLPEYKGIPPGTLCTIAKTGYIPKKWRRKLNIVTKELLATRARNAALKEIYNAKGWKSGSEFDTALLNGETELPEKV